MVTVRKSLKITIHRVYESLGVHVSYSLANGTSDGVTPETQTAAAEHSLKQELLVGRLKLSEQTGLIRWHSQRSEETAPERSRLLRSRALRKTSG